MAGFLDNAPFTFSCPKCGHKIEKTVGWIESNRHYTCTCGQRIDFDTDEFRQSEANVERALKNAFKDVKIKI